MYAEEKNGDIRITLKVQDWDTLCLALGYAAGAAMKDQDMKIANAFIRLANSINQGNPDWAPYATISQKPGSHLRSGG